MIRIIHCDDHKIVRAGIRGIIEDYHDLQFVAEAESGEKLLNLLTTKEVDVVILDISLPGRSGLDIIKQIKASNSGLHILVLSMHPAQQYAIRMLKSGASGYLFKDSSPDTLIKAIRTVAAGKRYISPEISDILMDEMTGSGNTSPHKILSDRELEVMILLGEGKSISEISNTLALSIKTVSTYKTRVLGKMNFQNIAALIKYVMEQDLSFNI